MRRPRKPTTRHGGCILWLTDRWVEVHDRSCATRLCFRLGFDRGVFTPGQGYTRLHRDARGEIVEYPICGQWHFYGCPLEAKER